VITVTDLKQKIETIRDRLDCSQQELARIMGITPGALSRWKNGNAEPRSTREKLFIFLHDKTRQARDPAGLKKKLLLAEVLANDQPPVRLLAQGRLAATLKEGIDELKIIEDLFLQEGMTFFELTVRRTERWVQWAREGKIEVEDLETWQEILRFIPYVEEYVATLLWDPLIDLPEEVGSKLGEILAQYLRIREIEPIREKYKKSSYSYETSWPARGVKGYLDATGRAATVLLNYLEQTPREELEQKWEGAEDLWQRFSWPGDRSLEETLNYIAETVDAELLDQLHFPGNWEQLKKTGQDPGQE